MTLYAMYTPKGKLLPHTVNAVRRECIAAECWCRRPWAGLRKCGYTVRKVTVVEVTE